MSSASSRASMSGSATASCMPTVPLLRRALSAAVVSLYRHPVRIARVKGDRRVYAESGMSRGLLPRLSVVTSLLATLVIALIAALAVAGTASARSPIQQIRRSFAVDFSCAPRYHVTFCANPKQLSVHGSVLRVRTSWAIPGGWGKATKLCAVLYNNYIRSRDATFGLSDVAVRGRGGQELAHTDIANYDIDNGPCAAG